MKLKTLIIVLTLSAVTLCSCGANPQSSTSTNSNISPENQAAAECFKDLEERLPGNVAPQITTSPILFKYEVSDNVALENPKFAERLSYVDSENVGYVYYLLLYYSVSGDEDTALYFLKDDGSGKYTTEYLGTSMVYEPAIMEATLKGSDAIDEIGWPLYEFYHMYIEKKYMNEDSDMLDRKVISEASGVELAPVS